MKQLLFAALLITSNLAAQKIVRPANLSLADGSLQKEMPRIARDVMARYRESSKGDSLDQVFRFQMVAGQFKEALRTLDSEAIFYGDTGSAAAIGLQYRTYSVAKLSEQSSSGPFFSIYADTLTAMYNRLSEAAKNRAPAFFTSDTAALKSSVEGLLGKSAGSDSFSVQEAAALLKLYNSWNVFRQILPVAKPFFKAEREKKFVTQDDILISMPDGAQLSATIVRRVQDRGPMPVILMYNIYSDNIGEGSQAGRATEAAEKGYVSMIVNTRGKKGSPQAIEPFEHDAKDAYYVIDWISRQSWCNGKVGMFGGSYLGFSQWSATKKLHPALKTIVPQVAVSIGTDYPSMNGIFSCYSLRWIHYVTNNKATDRAEFSDNERWNALFLKWFQSGKAFRTLDSIDGRPNAIFQRWISHPSYDRYWQSMVPFEKEFASINIPVLTTTGYFDDDQRGAFYYMQQHLKWNPAAQHYLIIGPWDHAGGQGFVQPTIGNYRLDEVATSSVNETVFKWFDHILKDSALPSALKDKINFEVAGANEWRSAPSLEAASNDSLVLYLTTDIQKKQYLLSEKKPAVKKFISQTISYGNRHQYDRNIEGDDLMPVDTAIYRGDDLVFVTPPLDHDIIMNGSFEARLGIVINKKDLDLNIRLYELTADGSYYLLSRYFGRASYMRDRQKRQLLQPGKEEQLVTADSYYGCRKIRAGSRIVAYVGMLKSPGWQVNYGTGKDVSTETMADGKIPMQIRWSNQSNLKIPLVK